MKTTSGIYREIFIKRTSGMVSMQQDVTDFCEKFIKPVHPQNWDWSKRDFTDPKNDPTIEEARAIRDVIYKDMQKSTKTKVDLSTITNGKAIKAFFNPQNKYEEFNMEEFAESLKVEIEHGSIRDANVTLNHPILTAMIVLAHMSETITYYKRLKIMEAEGKMYEIYRKLKSLKSGKDKWYKELEKAQEELETAQKELAERFEKVDNIPTIEELE